MTEPARSPLARLLWRHPRLFALGFGLVLAIVLLFVADRVVGLVRHRVLGRRQTLVTRRPVLHAGRPRPSVWYEGRYASWAFPRDAILGYRPEPLARITSRKMTAKGAMYDVTYDFDAASRRVTPAVPAPGHPPYSRYALFFGCSFTFGEGVNDDQAMPSRFAGVTDAYHAYNYGFCGYGTQQMLANLQDPHFWDHVQEKGGIGVYLFIDEHVRRDIGAASVICTFGQNFPRYVLRDARPVRDGTFAPFVEEARRNYDLLVSSNLVAGLNPDWPLTLGDDDFRLVGAMVNESARLLSEHAGRFYMAIYPGCTYGAKITPYLDPKLVHVIDLGGLFNREDPRYQIVGDGHPTPLAHDLVARAIARAVESDQDATR